MPEDHPTAADIEVTEAGSPRTGSGGDIVLPSAVRINGIKLLAPRDDSITVHEIDLRDGEPVRVTLTLYARRVRIGFADELHLATEELGS